MKQSVTVGAQLLWSGRYSCNNGRYGCTIVMSYIEINKAVSQWLLTFNLCVSVTWPLTCAFHIPCTHTPEIIDMHRGMCDNELYCLSGCLILHHVVPLRILSMAWCKTVVSSLLTHWRYCSFALSHRCHGGPSEAGDCSHPPPKMATAENPLSRKATFDNVIGRWSLQFWHANRYWT